MSQCASAKRASTGELRTFEYIGGCGLNFVCAFSARLIQHPHPQILDTPPHIQGFFQDFRQEGANATIVELRGGMYYSCIFKGFCHRGIL